MMTEPRYPRTVLLGILLLALAVRLVNLGAYSFWYDEAYSLIELERGLVPVLTGENLGSDSPLYLTLLFFWRQVADGEFGLRLLSAGLGLLAVIGTYRAAARIISHQAGLAAAGFVALSPFMIHYSQELRPYSLMVCLASFALGFLWDALNRPGRCGWFGYGLATVLLCYTHYFGLFFLLAVNLYYLIYGMRVHGKRRAWVLVNAAVGVLYLPWIGTLYQKVTDVGGHLLWSPPVTWHGLALSLKILLWGHHKVGVIWLVPGSLAVIFLLAMTLREARHGCSTKRGSVLLLAILAFAPYLFAGLLSLIGVRVMVHRYFIASAVPLALLIGFGWTALGLRWRSVTAAAIMLGFAPALGALYNNAELHEVMVSRKQPYAAMADQIESGWREGDVVLHFDRSSYAPIWYYSRHRSAQRLTDAQWVDRSEQPKQPALEHHVGMVPQPLDDTLAGHNGLWLVRSYWGRERFRTDPPAVTGWPRLEQQLDVRLKGWQRDPSRTVSFESDRFDWVTITYWRRGGKGDSDKENSGETR